MSLHPDLQALMIETITVKTAGATTFYGQPSSFSTRENVKCHIMRKRTDVTDRNGEEVTASHMLYVDSNDITVNDQIVMPDGSTRPVLYVQTHYDEEGPHHQVVYIT